MRVKVSKTMVKQLQKEFKNYLIVYEEMTINDYRWCVNSDLLGNENDYDYEKSKFKVIKVLYPYEYYAMPKYLTTNDLGKCFRKSNKTYNSFINEIKNEIEV